jgi:hypothetical protein
MQNLRMLLLAAVSSMAVACGGGRETMPVRVDDSVLDRVASERWVALSGKRIFFGHQSVGINLLDGIREIEASRPAITLAITETRDPAAFGPGGTLGHAKVGRNRQPALKMSDFRSVIDGPVGERLDIAMLKLCFVDVMADADVEGIARQYIDTMQAEKRARPAVRFVAMTVPLTSVRSGLKESVKSWLGRGAADFQDNVARHRLNEILRGALTEPGTLFDLAAAESTYPNGRANLVLRNGVSVPAMIPDYTDDGGHLSALGRKAVCQKLLAFLAEN